MSTISGNEWCSGDLEAGSSFPKFEDNVCGCRLFFLFFSLKLISRGYAISQIQVFVFSLSYHISSGLLDAVLSLRVKSKSHTSFP